MIQLYPYCSVLFATLETSRELEPKCVPRVFLGSLLGTWQSAIGLATNSPRSLGESFLDPVSVSVVKWRICIYCMFVTLPKPSPPHPTPPHPLFLLLGSDTFSSLKKNLPALCSVAAECVSAFSVEFWLQTQLLQVT